MVGLAPPFRPARPDDAEALAELIDFAGEGMPLYLWEKMTEPGETAWDVGRRRAKREDSGFSYRNATILEIEGAAVACLIGYALPDRPEAIDDDMPAMFVPLQELENLAPGTWYVNVLACYPSHRGQGYGTQFLALAKDLAAQTGARGLSIIVSDANTGARQLYERCGFAQIAMRPIVKDDWRNPGQNWVLLTKGI